jgi:hypothetical protein
MRPLRAVLLLRNQNPRTGRQIGLYLSVRQPYIPIMRPETQRSVEDIQQAIALLRRHL